MSESINEASHKGQLETNLAKVTEQLQALISAMNIMVVPRTAGGYENERGEDPLNRLNDDITTFDDDMAEYAA